MRKVEGRDDMDGNYLILVLFMVLLFMVYFAIPVCKSKYRNDSELSNLNDLDKIIKIVSKHDENFKERVRLMLFEK